MRNKKFFAVTGAALLLLAGCRTIPQNPEEMTCGDLQYLAEESIDKLGLPFFATQVKYPGDWRLFARNQWIKEGSRARVRDNKRDYLDGNAGDRRHDHGADALSCPNSCRAVQERQQRTHGDA